MRTRTLLTVTAALLTAGSLSFAGSIWSKGQHRTRKLTTDDTARDVGDILTIIINEQSSVDNSTSRSMGKSSSAKAKMGGKADLANAIGQAVGKNVFDAPRIDFDGEAENNFDGEADFDQDRKITDRITVVVEDVLPNGNLVVLGKRKREVNGDAHVVTLSGIVRPSDIAYNNAVSSDRVADFHLVAKIEGQENAFTKPGWLARVLNFLNPF
jgi:flagellar L-ring protein precursor FlgH